MISPVPDPPIRLSAPVQIPDTRRLADIERDARLTAVTAENERLSVDYWRAREELSAARTESGELAAENERLREQVDRRDAAHDELARIASVRLARIDQLLDEAKTAAAENERLKADARTARELSDDEIAAITTQRDDLKRGITALAGEWSEEAERLHAVARPRGTLGASRSHGTVEASADTHDHCAAALRKLIP